MFEELLEDLAQTNGLREVNTWLKLATGTGAIILCLLSKGYIPPLFIAALLTLTILIGAGIDAGTYARLFIFPVTFGCMGVAGIILVSGGSDVFWFWDLPYGFSLSVTRESVNQGFFVLCRIIGGMSALCFISLTTPMTDIFLALRRFRIPEPVIDLMMIIYRTIFILMDQVVQVYHAQVMRLGYSGYRESIRSFALLCGAAFIASWDAGDDLIRAMDARCYNGKFAVLGESRPVELLPFLGVIAFLGITAVVVILAGTTELLPGAA